MANIDYDGHIVTITLNKDIIVQRFIAYIASRIEKYPKWSALFALLTTGATIWGAFVFVNGASQVTGGPAVIEVNSSDTIAPLFGEQGYLATEAFCRDDATKVQDANIPERNGFVLTRTKDGIKEDILVVIDPQSNNVLYATYDSSPSNPKNAVITAGARKCFQDKLGTK